MVQARANGVDVLDWHDDRGDPARRPAITINLPDSDYDGGLFELREVASRRLLPVTRCGPRRVYTGWFLVLRATASLTLVIPKGYPARGLRAVTPAFMLPAMMTRPRPRPARLSAV